MGLTPRRLRNPRFIPAGDGTRHLSVWRCRAAGSVDGTEVRARRRWRAATLGEVLRGEHPGRTRHDEITAYSPVGLPWQDLALAWICYQHATQRDVGEQIDLLR